MFKLTERYVFFALLTLNRSKHRILGTCPKMPVVLDNTFFIHVQFGIRDQVF